MACAKFALEMSEKKIGSAASKTAGSGSEKKNRFLANGTFFAHPLDRSLPLVESLEKCRNYVISP